MKYLHTPSGHIGHIIERYDVHALFQADNGPIFTGRMQEFQEQPTLIDAGLETRKDTLVKDFIEGLDEATPEWP